MTRPGSLLRPLARQWVRGPATRDRDQIVIDARRAERYDPLALKDVGIALARVRTPDEAVTFAEAFGLLTVPRALLEGEPIPSTLQEPFVNFERAAEDLRRILRTTVDVRKAVKGDREALERIRQDFDTREESKRDDRSILIAANDWAALGLMGGMPGVRPYVYEPAQLFPDRRTDPGQIRIGLLAETLRDHCHVSVAQVLASEPLKTCEECGRVFIVEDGRQRFCEPTCASRARFRRFKTRRDDNANTGDQFKPKRHKRARTLRHGKKTRTR